MKRLFTILQMCFFVSVSWAQHITFADDEISRGWHDRPYLRYEAEQGKCVTSGDFLAPTYTQTELQCEATNQQAVQLISKDSYIQWTNSQEANGLTLRFSIPDNAEGNGTTGNLALYVDDVFVQQFTINSYWAWQYFLKSMSSSYPDNTPASDKFSRMRFDEAHWKLSKKINEGSVFKLVKIDDNSTPYTIDFVELEKVPDAVTFESIPDENKVAYSTDKGTLNSFIASNQGKTIYIPEGRYDVDKRIYITGNNTKLIGAGMWYTEIYFSASSDDRATYSQRGIEASGSNITLEGVFLNTVNNKRYYDNNSTYQVGKGLMGSFGSNSIIRNVWAEHFECGGWIEGADGLTISECRFRNNYADGMNLSYGSKNSIVERCSFRNNGDDDMASWSRSGRLCENNTYRYCIAENNWRASSLGFFGGKQNKAYNCVIIDPMEAGMRVNSDFPGVPFSSEGYSELYNISIYKGGVKNGSKGVSGDLWGNQQGAIHLNSSTQYDLQNVRIYNIDLYDSKNNAIFIGSGSRNYNNVLLKDIRIRKTGDYGIYFSSPKGNMNYCNITFENIGSSNMNTYTSAFTFTEDCTPISISSTEEDVLNICQRNGRLIISNIVNNSNISILDITGRKIPIFSLSDNSITTPNLSNGIYLVHLSNGNPAKKIFVSN